MDQEIRITRDFDDFLALEKDWNEMVSKRFGGHPFFGHFWYTNYYRAYFPKKPICVLTAHHADDIVGAVPMIQTNRRMAGVPLKEVRLLAGDHSHINRVLISPDGVDTAGLFLNRLSDLGVDLIYWEDLPDSPPDRQWIETYCRESGLALEIRSVRSSPFIPCMGNFDDFRKGLSKKFRELLNNRVNRINRAGGYEIKSFSGAGNKEPIIADLQNISRNSWQTKNGSGLFSGEANSQFYENLIDHSLKNNYGVISILYHKERPAAFEIHVIHGRTEYCLKAEYSKEFDRVSPGAVLDLELVKRAFASDIEVYDLLGYDDGYKLRWTKNRTPYYRYFIFNRSVTARVAYLLYYRIGNRLRNLRTKRNSG
jgi:CelD/BcsL family acetyltransferase involved in cellulose biosynthesis